MSADEPAPDRPELSAAEPAWPGWVAAVGAALLHPRTIRALLGTGGGFVVAGGLVWLVSLGVFEDPRVLAASLIAGCLAVLGLGWVLASRTRYRTAGLAAAGLACVALPLNLWLLHAQGLVPIDDGLWVWAAGCAGLQVATVWLLRDRRFLLAVQAGVTLTALLALGQFGRLDAPLWVAGTLAALGLMSVEGFRLFPARIEGGGGPGGPRPATAFARDPFAVPLLWGGAGLLAGAAGSAGLAELARHAAEWFPHLRLDLDPVGSRLIAAAVWVAVANGLVSLDRLAARVRDRADAAAGIMRDEGLFGVWSVVPAVAAGAGAAAVWNVLEHFGAPDAWDAAVFAACGVGLLGLARRAGVGVKSVDRGWGEAAETRGPGATAFRCGTVVLLGAELWALLRGTGALVTGPEWLDAGPLVAVAGLGWLGGELTPPAGLKTLHRLAAAGCAALAALVANALLDVPLARKIEAASLALGAALLTAAHAGRVREAGGEVSANDRRAEEERATVTIGLWFGTLFVLLPAAAAVFVARVRDQPWAADGLVLAASSAALLIVGLSARTLAPAAGGAAGLAGGAAVLVFAVAHRAEVTLGVGLTLGGAGLFAVGLALSVLRDRLTARLSALPRQWAHREGVFAVLDWR